MLLLGSVEPAPAAFAAGVAATVGGNAPELPAGRATSVGGVSVFEKDFVTSGTQNQSATTDTTASKAAFFGLAATSRRSFRIKTELTIAILGRKSALSRRYGPSIIGRTPALPNRNFRNDPQKLPR